MVRQVSSFVSRVGEFKNLKESPSPDVRSVVFTTAANINDLTAVLCAEDKLEMLLKFQEAPLTSEPNSSFPWGKADESVGKLVHVIISCASGLPLQTPCYAALTLAVHEQVKGTQYQGFAQRCVGYAMLCIARDLDAILLLGQDQVQAFCRAKLLVRYLATLGRMGVVRGYEEAEAPNSETETMTVFGLLRRLVEAATVAGERQKDADDVVQVLCALVLSTVPYIMEYVPLSVVNESLLQPIEALFGNYGSAFSPGIGMSAILLKEEQFEDDGEEEDDEDDDEEDDDDEAAGQICDSLQELLRATQRLGKGDERSRFCLPIDAPWKYLTRQSTPNPEGGEIESHPVMFSEDPIYLAFTQKFEAMELLLRGEGQFNLQCFGLEGIVFGRLPIFGSAPESKDDDEEEGGGHTSGNEQLKAFVDGYTFLDRFFVAETLRDCLICHESYVSPTGVQHGNAKAIAEELLSVHNVFSGEDPKKGLEYAILEALFALVAQSTERGAVRHTFLSSVLLELTRSEPSRFSPALALAMTNLFQDYLPALVPASRDNFSKWFACHLINTDYQWPGAFWQAWEPYATSKKHTSRGNFVRRALNVMADNVSDLSILEEDCLASAKSLSLELLCRNTANTKDERGEDTVAGLGAELCRRLWDNNEDPAMLRDYLLGDEVATAFLGTSSVTWSKTDALVCAIANPVKLMGEALENSLREKDGDGAMTDDQALSKDAFAALMDAIARYKETIDAVLMNEVRKSSTDAKSDNDQMVVIGQSFVLRALEKCCGFSANLLEGAVACVVRNGAVTPMAVAGWALGDLGDTIEAEVVPRWWCFTLDAMREQLDSLDTGVKEMGMVIDGGSVEAEQGAAKDAVEDLRRVLQYTVKRVCTLLVALQTDERRLNPPQVDLLEGMKKLASSGKAMLISFLAKETDETKGSPLHEVFTRISASQISNSALAGLCTGYETNNGVSLLRRSFLSA